MSSQKWRLGITIVLVVLAVIAFWKTFQLWTMTEEDKVALQEKDPGALLALQQKAIRLGLDLQGGIHVVLRVKTEELDEATRDGAVDRAIQVIRNRIDALGVAEPVIQQQGEDRIIVDLPGYTDPDRAVELIGQTAVLEFKLLETIDNASLIIDRIDSVVHLYEVANKAPDETAEVDEPTSPLEDAAEEVAGDETDMLAEMMGDSSADTLDFGFDETVDVSDDTKPFSSRLELSLYNNTTATGWPGYVVAKRDQQLMDKWLNLPEVQAVIPVDVQFAWSTRAEIRNQREVFELYLLKRKVQFVGRYLGKYPLRQ